MEGGKLSLLFHPFSHVIVSFDRICVGKYVASDFVRKIPWSNSYPQLTFFFCQMWLVIVSLLACFNMDKAKDEAGNEIEPDGTYLDRGIIRCVILSRKPFLFLEPDVWQAQETF